MLSSIRESEAESFRATPCSTHAETNRHIASARSGPHNATFRRVKKPAARRGPLTRRSTHIGSNGQQTLPLRSARGARSAVDPGELAIAAAAGRTYFDVLSAAENSPADVIAPLTTAG
jgi:hypothetical protein